MNVVDGLTLFFIMYKNINITNHNPNEVNGGSLYKEYQPFVNFIISCGFEKVDTGSFRTGYRRRNTFIKVPKSGDGVIDNVVEAIAWRKYRNNPTDRYIYLAPCRLLNNYCLMMPAVQINCAERPPWFSNLLDRQFGLYRNKYITYDYAFEITERPEIERDLGVRSEFFNSNLWQSYRQQLKEVPKYIPLKDNHAL